VSRKQSREIVFKLLFSLCFDVDGETDFGLVTDDKGILDERELGYINSLQAAVRVNLGEIDAVIEKHAQGFTLDRIFKIDLTVLRMAVGEVIYLDTPNVVAVNEAVELAKKYGTEKSGSYVNGILASVLRERG
jgi:N utilization substance protein B